MRVWALVLVAGCGRVGFDAQLDGAANDAIADAPCTFGAWSTPQPLAGPLQSNVDDWAGVPALGNRAVFLYSFRISAISHLWTATRASPTDDFGAATELTQIETGVSDRTPAVSEDALTLVWPVDIGSGRHGLRESHRTTTTFMFPAAFDPGLGTGTSDDSDPWLSADGNRLVFASDRGGGNPSVYETTRTSRDASFATPVLALAVPGMRIGGPSLSADGLDMYMSIGPDGMNDIYTAHRIAVDQPFAAPVPIPELNSAKDDVYPRVTHDGSTMYLNYDSVTLGGSDADVDTATRSCN